MILIIFELTFKHWFSDLTPEHYTDFGLMLGSCQDVESAEVPTMLEEIANEIYICGVTNDFLDVKSENGVEWLETKCPSANRLFRNFITRHAHRSIKEVSRRPTVIHI